MHYGLYGKNIAIPVGCFLMPSAPWNLWLRLRHTWIGGGAQAAMKAVVTQCGIKKKFQFILSGTIYPS